MIVEEHRLRTFVEKICMETSFDYIVAEGIMRRKVEQAPDGEAVTYCLPGNKKVEY